MTLAGREDERVDRVGDRTDLLGECALWCDQESALYWVDIREPAIRRWNSRSGAVESWPMPDLVGSIALRASGGLIVALRSTIALFDPADGTLERIASIPARDPEMRSNDGRCDRRGRFWVGTMHNVTREPVGELYRFDAAHRLVPVAGGVCIPNSLAWSPDGATMYFADSLRRRIDAYAFDADTGMLRARRTFAHTEAPGIPDGSTVDAEGCLWNAEYDAWRVVRYAPDGAIDRVVELPVQRPTSCTFGGPNLDVLYITTATQQLSADELARQPLAGAVLAFDAGVRGLPEPRYIG